MTCSQYKNVIQYTLADKANQGKDNLELARCILDNLGVPLPKGDCRDVLVTLMDGDYMDWTQCFKAQACASANSGHVTIGLKKDDVVVIEPDESIIMLGTGLSGFENPVGVTADEIPQEDMLDMQFFAWDATAGQQGIAPTSNSCAWWCGLPAYGRCGRTWSCSTGGSNPGGGSSSPSSWSPGIVDGEYRLMTCSNDGCGRAFWTAGGNTRCSNC